MTSRLLRPSPEQNLLSAILIRTSDYRLPDGMVSAEEARGTRRFAPQPGGPWAYTFIIGADHEHPQTIQPALAHRKRVVHTALSLLGIALGIALLIYMITVEDEPGALPLALLVGGTAWLIISRVRMRPRQ